ncbi:hypothetical protein ACS0TY_008072 [Phlomoides rotata]
MIFAKVNVNSNLSLDGWVMESANHLIYTEATTVIGGRLAAAPNNSRFAQTQYICGYSKRLGAAPSGGFQSPCAQRHRALATSERGTRIVRLASSRAVTDPSAAVVNFLLDRRCDSTEAAPRSHHSEAPPPPCLVAQSSRFDHLRVEKRLYMVVDSHRKFIEIWWWPELGGGRRSLVVAGVGSSPEIEMEMEMR